MNDTGNETLLCEFDYYWVYAIVVPFLGVIFNGLLLIICASFQCRTSTRQHFISASSRENCNNHHECAALSGVSTERTYHYPGRPEFALNIFVANCAAATFLGSCMRTVTTTYLFSYQYVLCAMMSPAAGKALDILTYIQYSIFSVAYINFLIVLNLDKLLFIMKPLHYRALMTRQRVTWVCVITWLMSMAWFPLYFSNTDEDVVRWGTILVTVLMIGPSVFCLVTSTILAVVVFRLRTQDRANNNSSRERQCAYCKSLFRLFQAILWTSMTSLPHPLATIISYYASVDPANHLVVKFIIGYLAVAYFSGTPFMIMWMYPTYWRRLKWYLTCKWP